MLLRSGAGAEHGDHTFLTLIFNDCIIMDAEKKRAYFQRVAAVLRKHGLVDQELKWENWRNDALVRGLRVMIHAATEPAIAWDPETEKALQAIIRAAEEDPRFARRIHELAKRYGHMFPRHLPPEAKVAQIAEIPLYRVTPMREIHRVPKSGDALKKYLLVRDIEALTRLARSSIVERGKKR